MKYFTFFLACMLFVWVFPNATMAQASCQPKSCAKKMADKAEKTAKPYLTVDFKAITQPGSLPGCSKKSEAKAVKTSGEAALSGAACKPDCDPKDCPPVCPPGCCQAEKASAQQTAQQIKASCDPEDCPPECKKHC